MLLAWILAQVVVPTPVPIATSAPVAASESQLLDNVVGDAAGRARALDGTLGVVVIDLGTGTHASRNADRMLPTQSVQKLPIAVLIYRAIEKGVIPESPSIHTQLDDMIEASSNDAAKSLLTTLGGAAAANGALNQIGYGGITLDADDNGSATASDIARLLQAVNDGSLLSQASQKKLLAEMAAAHTFPGRLRAGFPPKTVVMHKTGTSTTVDGITDATNDVGLITVNGRTLIIVAMLQGARGDDRRRDGLIAGIARGVYNATLQFPI